MTENLSSQISKYVHELEAKDAEALVAVFDRNGYYLYASFNHKQALGYTAKDLLSMHLSQIIDPSLHHAAWVLRTVSVFYTKPVEFSSRLVAKSGELVHIKGTLRHMHERGSERYFISCVKPVSP